MKYPEFLKKSIPKQENIRKIRGLLDNSCLHTVCESAKCPNIGECFSKQTLTFMIMGNICTRNCKFCAVGTGIPTKLDENEPQAVLNAVKKLNLNYVVITSVTRDDLLDGGANHYKATIELLKNKIPNIQVEVLIPDLKGELDPLKLILSATPYVLNHNIETIPRLYPTIRPQAQYERSLNILRQTKKFNPDIYTKSGFMVGLGETKQEIFDVLCDLKNAGADIATIGQYLAPSKDHYPIQRFVEPKEYSEYQEFGENLGLKVFAGPFVRSSYHAKEIVNEKI